jgi:predicted acetyltransferase
MLPASELRTNVRRLDRVRDGKDLRRVYDEARARTTGPLARSEYWWEVRVLARIAEGVVYVDPGAGKKITGYALYDLPKEPRYPSQHLIVRELVASSPDAFRGLVGFFEAQGEQAAMVELDQPAGAGGPLCSQHGAVGSPIDLRIPPVAVYSLAGCMGRIVDLDAALALHPGPLARKVKGRLGLDLSDPVFAAQSRPLDVTFGARGATVQGGRSARDRLVLSVDRLAQVYFGGASAETLREQGLIGGSVRAAALLDQALAGPAPFLLRPNFF